jgi:hypothetical protein
VPLHAYPSPGLGWAVTALLLSLSLLLAACSADDAHGDNSPVTGATETATLTPAGDFLKIDGQPVTSVFVPVAGEPALYALTERHLYRQGNHGWEKTGTVIDGRAIVVNPLVPEVLFQGDHPPCDNGDVAPTTLAKSTDAGDTWTAIPSAENIEPLAVDASLPEVVYGSNCELVISVDGGETWQQFEPETFHDIVAEISIGARLLVIDVTPAGVSRLLAVRVDTPDKPEVSASLLETAGAISLDADAERIVVGGARGVEVSLDGGETWDTSSAGLEAVTAGPGTPLDQASDRSEIDVGILSVKIDPTKRERIFAGSPYGLFVSQDNGASWDRYDLVSPTLAVLDIAIGSSGADLYVTTDEGVMVIPNP